MKNYLLIALFLSGLASPFAMASAPQCPDGFEVHTSAANDGSFSCIPIKAAISRPAVSTQSSVSSARQITAETILAFSTDHDIGKAKAGYTKALELDHAYAPAHFGMGVMLEAEENWEAAREAFQKVVSTTANPLSVPAKEEIWRIVKIIELNSTADGKKQRRYNELIAQARALLADGQLADAAKTAAEAKTLDSARWQVYAVEGEVALKANLPEQAKRFYNEASKHAPTPYKERLEKVALELLIPMVAIHGKNYAMGKYEVTQGEWKAVMGSNPSHFSSCGDTCPVENVSWNDVQVFIQKLNAKTSRQYRLPTEAEWEYACNGGSQAKYCGGNNLDEVGWYDENSGKQTHPVGQKQANDYGLYDMSGNVMEWMSDCYDGDCKMRALRGGAFFQKLYLLMRAANRSGLGAADHEIVGFRLASNSVNENVAVGKTSGLKFDVSEYHVSGLEELSIEKISVNALLGKYAGVHKNYEDISQAAVEVSRFLRRKGYFLAQAYIAPQQQVGRIELVVLPGTLGSIKLNLAANVSNKNSEVRELISGLKTGDFIDEDKTMRLFYHLRRSGVDFRSSFEPGEKVGASDLTLEVISIGMRNALPETEENDWASERVNNPPQIDNIKDLGIKLPIDCNGQFENGMLACVH